MKFSLSPVVVSIAALLLSSAVVAQPNNAVVELHALDSPRGTMVLAISGNGVTFVDGKKGTSFRAFKSKRSHMKGATTDWVVIRDVDSNGTVDVVGAGKPAFIVSAEGAPIYSITRGCGQFHLANFTADSAPDILCRDGNTIRVLTYNGQELWKWKVGGITLGACNFGDVNGDLQTDIECEVKRKGTYLRLSGDGEELGRDYDGATLGPAEDDNPRNAEAMANLLKGKETFDLDGDGTAEEWIKADGTNVVVSSKSSPKGLGSHPVGRVYSALVADIDGDGKNEIVIGGEGKVVIIDHEGKLVATVAVDPTRLKRATDVRVGRVNANGLKDSGDEVVAAAISKHVGGFAACYSGNVRSNPFTQVGRAIFNVSVDKKGKVSKVERLHSEIEDKKVQGCLKKVLKKAKFSPAVDADASVTVTLEFGFVDR